MNTYYALRYPITSLNITESGAHIRVIVFIKGQNAGIITLRKEERHLLYDLFTCDDTCVTVVGKALTKPADMKLDAYVIGRDGHLHTIRELLENLDIVIEE